MGENETQFRPRVGTIDEATTFEVAAQELFEQPREFHESAFLSERVDHDGIREVLVIDNERVGGCPFQCEGCGVKGEAKIVSAEENKARIGQVVDQFALKLTEHKAGYSEQGYHLCIYNFGNVTDKKELSKDNFYFLLQRLSALDPLPEYVSINSRGDFVDEELLSDIAAKQLPYRVHFILGVETFTERGQAIYGKKNIGMEADTMVATIQHYNKEHGTNFGMDINLVFLPEFYLAENDSRAGHETEIQSGFSADVQRLLNYGDQGMPIRINLHPYYKSTTGKALPYTGVDQQFGLFMQSVAGALTQLDHKQDIVIFVGVEDSGYQTAGWKEQLAIWGGAIQRINALKDYNNEAVREIITEIQSHVPESFTV